MQRIYHTYVRTNETLESSAIPLEYLTKTIIHPLAVLSKTPCAINDE